MLTIRAPLFIAAKRWKKWGIYRGRWKFYKPALGLIPADFLHDCC